ncbi:MAG: hypothetical protein LQ343_005204 [Gyalolechia ehrenbergii]|nr:MAG: hypothetical protein LQ343_005204 [Gyalolechia ehrenbergii]
MPSPSSSQPGQALPPMRCNELVEYVLQSHKAPTTIIICSSRKAFLESLQLSLEAQSTDQEATGTPNNQLHPLLVPTIHQLAASRTIGVAFTPTLPHLRAYLASYNPGKSSTPGSLTFTWPDSHVSMLAIYGLLALHRATTEFSLQGLSRSLAIAAEAANTWGLQLILTEDAQALDLQHSEPRAEGETASPQNCWTERVPVLSSSLALSNDRAWAGRTVVVGSIVAKWCRIIRQ